MYVSVLFVKHINIQGMHWNKIIYLLSLRRNPIETLELPIEFQKISTEPIKKLHEQSKKNQHSILI